MKNLELCNYGVQEMNAMEAKETNGGSAFLWLIAGIIVAELLDRNAPKDFAEGFAAGRA